MSLCLTICFCLPGWCGLLFFLFPSLLGIADLFFHMPSPAQRERTQLRTKLYTGHMIPSNGRGGGGIDESDLLPMWPKHLDMEHAAAKPTLTLPDIAAMLGTHKTPAFHAMVPRTLSGSEITTTRTWLARAEEQRRTDLGDPLATVQNNIEKQAAANQDEIMEQLRAHGEKLCAHGKIRAHLDNPRKSGRESQKEATQRKQEEWRDKYFNALRGSSRPLPDESLQRVALYKAKLQELHCLVAERKHEVKIKKKSCDKVDETIQQKLKQMSVMELRKQLRENGKDSTGKKSMLVERVLSARTAATATIANRDRSRSPNLGDESV